MGIERRRSSTELHLRTAIEQSPLATDILVPDGRCLLVNDAWNALWGLGEDGLPEGSSVFESERLRTMGLTAYPKECRQNGEVSAPHLFREATPETRLRWLRAFIYPVREESGALLEMGLVLEDFTERKALKDQLVHQAFHDPLTGLPNRVLFLDRLSHARSRAKREAERSEACRVALLYMDLDPSCRGPYRHPLQESKREDSREAPPEREKMRRLPESEYQHGPLLMVS